MGEVYEAVQREHGRRVAVKVVTGRLTDPVDRSRFLREGQLAASSTIRTASTCSAPRGSRACR